MGKSCGTCGNFDDDDFDPFGGGQLLDFHMDCEVSEEEITQRVSDAIAAGAQFCGGNLPSGIAEELGDLVKPKLRWEDYIRHIRQFKKQHNSRQNNWNAPKRKSLFSGIFSPTKRDYHLRILVGIDASASMSNQQETHLLSQLIALDGRAEIIVVFWDSRPFWEHKLIAKTGKIDEIRKIKRIGGGGTVLKPLFDQYKKEVGEVDIIIVGSDFFLFDEASIRNMKKPNNTEVIWISANGNPNFKFPFGRSFRIMND